MNRLSLIITIIAFFAMFEVQAKKKEEYPRAEIKVGYTYHETFVRGSDGIIKRDIPFILLASKEHSKFYNVKTEFKDSLESTPQGRAISHQLLKDALKRYTETKDESAMNSLVYQTSLYIIRKSKNPEKPKRKVQNPAKIRRNHNSKRLLKYKSRNIGMIKKSIGSKQIRCSFFAYRSRNIIKHYVRVMGIIVH